MRRPPKSHTRRPDVREVFIWLWWRACDSCEHRVWWESMWTWRHWVRGYDGGYTATYRVCQDCASDEDMACLVKRQIEERAA